MGSLSIAGYEDVLILLCAVINVVHDLSLTRLYGSSAALLHEGSLLGKGPVNEVLSPGLLQTAYGMNAQGYMIRLMKAWEK